MACLALFSQLLVFDRLTHFTDVSQCTLVVLPVLRAWLTPSAKGK